jgi:hypothetical protein
VFKLKMQDKAKNNTISNVSNVSNISVWLSNKLSGNGMHCISIHYHLIAQEITLRTCERVFVEC